jgi:hypothetical protein
MLQQKYRSAVSGIPKICISVNRYLRMQAVQNSQAAEANHPTTHIVGIYAVEQIRIGASDPRHVARCQCSRARVVDFGTVRSATVQDRCFAIGGKGCTA